MENKQRGFQATNHIRFSFYLRSSLVGKSACFQ